jgi:hypothetical protein
MIMCALLVLGCLACLVAANAFSVMPAKAFAMRALLASEKKKIDYDAPLERRIAAGDIVKSGEGKPLLKNPKVLVVAWMLVPFYCALTTLL